MPNDNSPPQIERFGKKMMPPEKSNIKFGENGLDVKSPQKKIARDSSMDSEKKMKNANNASYIELGTKSHDIRSGSYF